MMKENGNGVSLDADDVTSRPDDDSRRLTPRRRAVLDAAARLADRGLPVGPVMIARELGEADDDHNLVCGISKTIRWLRDTGQWPHARPPAGRPPRTPQSITGRPAASARPSSDPESEAVARCAAALASLDPDARRRVWRYLVDRFGEDQSR